MENLKDGAIIDFVGKVTQAIVRNRNGEYAGRQFLQPTNIWHGRAATV